MLLLESQLQLEVVEQRSAPVDPGYGGDTIVNSPVGIITAKGGGYGGFSPGYEIGGKNGGSQGGARSNSPMPLTFPGPSFGHPLGNTYDYPSDGVAADYGGNNYANWSTPSFDAVVNSALAVEVVPMELVKWCFTIWKCTNTTYLGSSPWILWSRICSPN